MRKCLSFVIVFFILPSYALGACDSFQSDKWATYTEIYPGPVDPLKAETVKLYAYRQWPSYMPQSSIPLQPQVVVINGGSGKVDCTASFYDTIGLTASYYWRQAIVLDLNYFRPDDDIRDARDSIEDAAAYLVYILNTLVYDGYLRPSFYLMGGSAGTAVMSAALDYHPDFKNMVERAIFVSGPFTGVKHEVISNEDILQLMYVNNIDSIDSLDYSMPYNPIRYNQWIKPIMDKKGLRFYVAQDDDVFCKTPSPCAAGTIYEEFLNWLSIATDDTESQTSMENLGALTVYPQGGHDLFETHPELLHDALSW